VRPVLFAFRSCRSNGIRFGLRAVKANDNAAIKALGHEKREITPSQRKIISRLSRRFESFAIQTTSSFYNSLANSFASTLGIGASYAEHQNPRRICADVQREHVGFFDHYLPKGSIFRPPVRLLGKRAIVG
jgi:hypothetical protein